VTVSVNGIAVDAAAWPSAELAAARELLRQRAVACALLRPDATDMAEVDAGINRLLASEVPTPSPGEAECRRYYAAHPQEFRSGDLVHVRHILFQVTPRVPLPPLRAKAEQTLHALRSAPDRFADLAMQLSNCPSARHGGNLGQIGRGDTVPEFEQALFAPGPPGIMRQLVRTRYGFHIVAVDRRIRGAPLPFDAVRDSIAERLRQTVEARALRQYVSILAGQAEVAGVDLRAAETPLVQ
jgi:peptidyl-prolyl cis-trans isomerase C